MHKTQKMFMLGIPLTFVLCLVWLYVRANHYEIVFQRSYGSAVLKATTTRGHRVRSASELGATLREYGMSETNLFKEGPSANWDNEFVFIVENGVLLEMYSGNS